MGAIPPGRATAAETRERVVALWAENLTSGQISQRLGITRGRVTAYVCDARDAGDRRAERRRGVLPRRGDFA